MRNTRLTLAHGAGAPMDSALWRRLQSGWPVSDFAWFGLSFLTWLNIGKDGKRRLPDKLNVLTEAYRVVLSDLEQEQINHRW